jgi:hypothetical protein
MNLRTWAVVSIAAVVAVVSARPYAGGWNDGSRLATVECLVDHRTWVIDDSIFVRPSAQAGVYRADDPMVVYGTLDKLFIGGHFYSDKSPVPAVFMAGEYAVLKKLTGWTAATRSGRFCWWMCLLTSGLAYVWAVASIDRLGRALQLSPWIALGLTASFAFATVVPVYARHVNNHILLLAVAAALLVELVNSPRALLAGALAGLAYTIDLGAGPVIALGAAGLIVHRRGLKGLLAFAAAALPFIALHHALNYMIGGTFGPANANVDYLMWPGSPFNADNATGGWTHQSFGHFLLYGIGLLVGHKGFLIHNLPLLLAVPATAWLAKRQGPLRAVIVMAAVWAVGTWLAYSAASNNSGGQCCSIRWFVPLLAPGYFVLALLLREMPEYRRDFAALSLWGGAMGVVMWQRGPWMQRLVPFWWVYAIGAVATWVLVRRFAMKREAALSIDTRRAA